MKREVVELLSAKIDHALKDVDSRILEAARAEWKDIGPSPKCPALKEVMSSIRRICHDGLIERRDIVENVVVATLTPLRDLLTNSLRNDAMAMVGQRFAADTFVAIARNTLGVYKRRNAPPSRVSDKSYESELASFTAMNANLNRDAVARIGTVIDELLLRQIALRKPWWRSALGTIWLWVLTPAVKWVFGILATVVAAYLTDGFGLTK